MPRHDAYHHYLDHGAWTLELSLGDACTPSLCFWRWRGQLVRMSEAGEA